MPYQMSAQDFLELRPDQAQYVNYTKEGDNARLRNVGSQAISNAASSTTKTAKGTGTLAGGLRAINARASQSRMSLPLSDVARGGSKSFSQGIDVPQRQSSSEMSDFDLFNKLSSRSLQDRGAMGAQDIDLTKRKIREVDTLANNEANRAMGMSLATQFPYKKYESESTSAREIMNNAQSAIPTFLNRATAARLSPVSMSL